MGKVAYSTLAVRFLGYQFIVMAPLKAEIRGFVESQFFLKIFRALSFH